MGIYLHNMEMPKEGNWRSIRIYPDGTIGRPIGFGDYALVEGAKAVPVPPHGRLIDADALANSITGAIYHSDLRDAPTIIPAEEGET